MEKILENILMKVGVAASNSGKCFSANLGSQNVRQAAFFVACCRESQNNFVNNVGVYDVLLYYISNANNFVYYGIVMHSFRIKLLKLYTKSLGISS